MLKYFTCILFFYTQLIYAQHETDTRVVGYQGLMKFDQNNQVQLIQSSSPLYNPVKVPSSHFNISVFPNSICDTLGKLLFYYEGANVFRADGSLMSGGNVHTLNFSSYYTSSLIVPIEESNRRYYYLYEAIPYEENWIAYQKFFDSTQNMPNQEERGRLLQPFWDSCRLVYHVIDMHADGGKGAVVKKNIHLFDALAPTISGVKHADNIATWVSVFRYNSDQLINFKVTSCGIVDTVVNIIYDYDNLFYKNNLSYQMFQNAGLQMVYSPRGDYVSFRGHLKSSQIVNEIGVYQQSLFILPFNNVSGIVDNSGLNTINVISMYNSNLFSTDSKFLYYDDSQFPSMSAFSYQYDLNSNVSIPVLLNKSKNKHFNFDYGKKNNLLIFKADVTSSNNYNTYFYLGEIINVNQQFQVSNLIDTLLTNRIPFSYSLQRGGYSRNNYIYNFYHPDYKKPASFPQVQSTIDQVVSPVCYTTGIDVKAHSSVFADSAYWLIQNQKTLVQQKIYTTTFTQAMVPGNYKAYYVSYKNCLSDTASQEILVESVPVIPPMEDTLYTCEGKTLDLPVNTTTLYWSNSNQDLVNGLATTEGQYTAHLQNTCAHVTDSLYVVNSIFSMNNLITPNGDGKNDCMYLESNNQKEKFKLEIYNSWGNKVLEQSSLNQLWCPANVSDGIYYYQLNYNQKDCIKKGWLEVIH